MSQEQHAREGAQSVVPDEQILDVAVVRPKGSMFAGVVGTVVGMSAGNAMGNAGAWGVAGGMLAQRAGSASQGSYPSIVLAATPDKVHILGRSKTGLVGGWKHLHPVAHIDRANLQVDHHRRGAVIVLKLTDTTTNTTLEFESQNIGGLGLKEFLALFEG